MPYYTRTSKEPHEDSHGKFQHSSFFSSGQSLNQNSNMKGIGIKHCEDKSENIITIESIASAVDLSSDTKQLISVNSFQYHKPFTTDTVEIQQDEIDTRMRENRKLRPNQTGLDKYSWIKNTYFYFYFSRYM